MHLKLEYFYLALILLNFNQIFCKHSLRPIEVDKNAQIISDILQDIVDEFFIKERIGFHIIVFKSLASSNVEVLNKFLETRNDKFFRTIQLHKENTKIRQYDFMQRSAILFLRSLDDIIDMEKFYWQLRKGHEPIKYFIYIPNLTFSQLESSTILSKLRYLDIFSRFLFLYEFFILDEPGVVTLSTIEWFRVEKCGEAQLTKVNVFDKRSGKWMKKLENYEKFLQYNGCELILMMEAINVEGIVRDVSNYAIVHENLTNFVLKGIVPKVFEIAAKVHNFSTFYQPAIINRDDIEYLEHKHVQLVPINGSKKRPSVYFFAGSNTFRSFNMKKTSHAFVDTSFRIFVTPGEAYSPYEKLFLPFDLETWIMLAVTFLTTILSILIINRLSKSTQTIVYGHRVYTPFWNVVSIFFGISLTRLPSKNFSRFILTLFVFFCLIFRTCFQSKLFEFMTSEPRRPPPKTIEDLIENGFTLYLMEENNVENFFHSYAKRLNITNFKMHKFDNLFTSKSQNPSAKLALLVDEFWLNHNENSSRKTFKWNQLKDAFFVSHDCFIFDASSFYFRMFNKIINRLIDTGVMKYLSDNYYTKTPKFDPIYSEPEVLSLDDMMFGFNIWLGFCGISVAGFVAEIFYRVFTVKFTKIYPQVAATNDSVCELKAETIKKFRANIKTPEMQHPVGFQMEVAVEVHNFVDNSKVDECEDKDTNVEENKHEIANLELKSIPKAPNMYRNSQNYDEIVEFVDLEDLLD